VTWYQRSCEVIREVMREYPHLSGRALRKAVSEAYPFGQRSMYPYKAWLKAVNRMLGPEKAKAPVKTHVEGQGTMEGLDEQRSFC